MGKSNREGVFIIGVLYFPYVYRTIPVGYDDSMSYYEQLLAISKILEEIGGEITKIEETINGISDSILKDVKKELENFKNVIDDEISNLNEKINIEITALRDEVEKALLEHDINFTKKLNQFEKEIRERVNAQDNKISEVETRFFNSLSELDIKLNGRITTLRNELFDLTESINLIYTYIDEQNSYYWNEVKKYCDELYKRRTIYYVKNPITKTVMEINKTLEMLYHICSNALTAREYEFLGLPAQEYADLKLTCIEYLRGLRNLYDRKVFKIDFSMQNPYSGKFETIMPVIKQLIKFHEEFNSLTAAEYAALQLTADGYFAKGATAYNYYVLGKHIFQ